MGQLPKGVSQRVANCGGRGADLLSSVPAHFSNMSASSRFCFAYRITVLNVHFPASETRLSQSSRIMALLSLLSTAISMTSATSHAARADPAVMPNIPKTMAVSNAKRPMVAMNIPSQFHGQIPDSQIIFLRENSPVYATMKTAGSRLFAMAFAAAALVLCAPNAQAQGFGESAALPQWISVSSLSEERPLFDLAKSVGLLKVEYEDRQDGRRVFSTCTATLVSIDYLLTNAHCIPGPNPGLKVVSAKLAMDYLSDSPPADYKYPVEIAPMEDNYDPHLDYAVVRVRGNPAVRYGYAPLSVRNASADEKIFIVHHPGEQTKKVSRDESRCRTDKIPIQSSTLRYGCPTMPGTSGALIFSLQDNRILALHRANGMGTSFEEIMARSEILQGIAWQQKQVGRTLEQNTVRPPPVAPAPTAIGKVDAVGRSGRLLSSKYGSYAAMSVAGCQEAKNSAVDMLEAQCTASSKGKLQNVIQTKSCEWSGERVREYSWTFRADCVAAN